MAYTYSYDKLAGLKGSVLYSGQTLFPRFRKSGLQYDRNAT